MLKERDRFDKKIKSLGFEPLWAETSQFLNQDQCLSLVGDIDGWLAGDDQITETVLAKAIPQLKIISKWGTGVDSIDLDAAKKLGVQVANSPAAFAQAVSEVAIYFILSLSRHLVTIDRQIRSGSWPKYQGRELSGAQLGIIGFGAIGQKIADLASAFGMNICFYDICQKSDIHREGKFFKYSDLNSLAQESDFICLACNYNNDNHHMINGDFLKMMKQSAFLINVARGALIDEKALIDALHNKYIAGAGLDVFEIEPLSKDNPLLEMDNVILGSHNANNGYLAVEAVHENTLQNLVKVLSQ
ncbi:MAG: phosphoglycerate dehydrogenase [Pseudomonadota bacterium]